MTLIKIVGSALTVLWGYYGIKTFGPIIKDIHKQQVFGSANPNGSPEKRSKNIKVYKRKFFKIVIAMFILNFIGCFYARDFLNKTADGYINAEYDRRVNASTTSDMIYPSN